MNVRQMVLVAVAVQIVAGVVVAILVDASAWARVESLISKYVLPVNLAVLTAVSGSTWIDKLTASKTDGTVYTQDTKGTP